jgi:flagellar hook-basal body complex protein FliE
MVDQFQAIGPSGLSGIDPKLKSPASVEQTGSGKDFKSLLMDSIDEVNRLQAEADQAQVNLVTGKTQNVEEVFTAVKKAEIAFNLLTQIQRKLMDAYDEVKQMRV